MRRTEKGIAVFAGCVALPMLAAYGDVATITPVPLTFNLEGVGEVDGSRISVLQVSTDGSTVGGIIRAANPGGTYDDRGYIWTVGSSSDVTMLQDPNYNSRTGFDGVAGDGSAAVGAGTPPKNTPGDDDYLEWNASGNPSALPNPDGYVTFDVRGVSDGGQVAVGDGGVSDDSSEINPFVWEKVDGSYTATVITNNGTPVVGEAYAVSPDGSTVYIENGSTYTQWTVSGGIQSSTNQNLSPLFAIGTVAQTFITPQLGTQNLVDYLVNQGLTLQQAEEASSPSSFTIIDGGTKVEYGSNNNNLGYVVTMDLPTDFPAWNVDADGEWGTSSNWTTGSPNGAGAYAILGSAITAPRTITLEADKTIACLILNSSQSYTLTGPGALNLNSASIADIQDLNGSHTINNAITATTSLTAANTNNSVKPAFDVMVANAGDTLTLSGGISSTIPLTKQGAGTLVISSPQKNESLSGLFVTAGTVQLGKDSGTTTIVGPLSFNGTGQLDVNNDELIVNYGTSDDPIGSIRAELLSGYANGTWSGLGITSSAAAADSASYGLGFADSADPGNPAKLSPGTLEIKYTLLGDANLDGVVNGSDFSILAANFGLGSTNWDQGDFLFTSAVNGSDFSALARNFGQGDSGAANSADFAALESFAVANGISINVPEPASIALIVVGGALVCRRRRRGVYRE